MNLCGLLLAFGFGNWLMLSWLAAAAVPLAIHLWNRRKYREVSWAAIEYLLAALRKNARRIQIEQWVLLAIRTLIIVLVALAVAEPYLEGARLDFATGQRTLKVLVIDGSYSMAYRPTDQSRFERAKLAAEKIVEESPAGDAFLLVVLADPPVVVVGSPAHEPSDFLAEIDNLRLAQGLADLPATLARVEEVLNCGRQFRPHAPRGLLSHRSGPQHLGTAIGHSRGRNPISRASHPAGRHGLADRRRSGPKRGRKPGRHPSGHVRTAGRRRPRSRLRRPSCNRSPPGRATTNWSNC